jgi:hypothetical protein
MKTYKIIELPPKFRTYIARLCVSINFEFHEEEQNTITDWIDLIEIWVRGRSRGRCWSCIIYLPNDIKQELIPYVVGAEEDE